MSEYSKIIGHENIISQLISAVSMSKINHAYILMVRMAQARICWQKLLHRLFCAKSRDLRDVESVILQTNRIGK